MTLPRALVEAVHACERGGIAAFDADGTLWREDVGEAFLRHLVALGWVRLPDGRDPYQEYERAVDRDRRRTVVARDRRQASEERDVGGVGVRSLAPRRGNDPHLARARALASDPGVQDGIGLEQRGQAPIPEGSVDRRFVAGRIEADDPEKAGWQRLPLHPCAGAGRGVAGILPCGSTGGNGCCQRCVGRVAKHASLR